MLILPLLHRLLQLAQALPHNPTNSIHPCRTGGLCSRLTSLIEIGALTVAIWQLTGVSQRREKNALRSIGTAFFVLATYI